MTSADRSNRRDFLRGRAALQALANVVAGPEVAPDAEQSPQPARRPPQHIVSLARRAMACEFEVQLLADSDETPLQPALEALDLVEALEAQLTVYRDDSELLALNRRAASEPVEVEPQLFALLELAASIHRTTAGAFDPTSGPLSDAWGFSRRAGRLPAAEELAAALTRVGMHNVILDAPTRTVAFRRPGLALHTNSIGKGYALDRMAELLRGAGQNSFLLHGGRSSVLAWGDGPDGARGWAIGIPHPILLGERLLELRLVNRAIGTSGSGTQFFEHAGRRYGHLLDPRNGRPVEGLFTATALAPTAAEADALSTAFYVMGLDKVARFCETRPDVAAILVAPAAEAGGVAIKTFNLAETKTN